MNKNVFLKLLKVNALEEKYIFSKFFLDNTPTKKRYILKLFNDYILEAKLFFKTLLE